MQNPPVMTRNEGTSSAMLAKRDRALAMAFHPDEMVWLAGERYDDIIDTWIVDVVRMSKLGRWMHQRYSYDTTNSVIYFMGERPATDDELATLRHKGKVFPVGKLRQQSGQ